MATVKQINQLVSSVLPNSVDVWMDSAVQHKLKALLKGKKTKDPNAPKRPMSAYIFYCQENRNDLKKTLPDDVKNTDIIKTLSTNWNELKNSSKGADKKKYAHYTKLALDDKERYIKEKGEKEQDEPKKPLSAYLLFCQDNRDAVKNELGDVKPTDVTKELGKRWKELKENDKETFESYKLKESENKGKKVQKSGASSKKVSNVKNETPFQKFSQAKREDVKSENPTLKNGGVNKKLSAMWKELSDEEQKEWM